MTQSGVMVQHSVVLLRSEYIAWDGLRTALDGMSDVHVTGDIRDQNNAMQLVSELQPSLIVISASFAEPTTYEFIASLRDRIRYSKLVIVAEHISQLEKSGIFAFDGLEATLLWSDITPGRFHRCLTTIIEDGYIVSSRQVAEACFDALHQRPPGSPLTQLTIRENEILQLVLTGLTDIEVASHLQISYSTVQNHIHSLLLKFNVTTRIRLGYLSAQHGFRACMPLHDW